MGVCDAQVEIGYAPSEKWVAVAEVIADVEAGEHSSEPLARLVHAQQLAHCGMDGRRTGERYAGGPSLEGSAERHIGRWAGAP
jgi:hypothetical protein